MSAVAHMIIQERLPHYEVIYEVPLSSSACNKTSGSQMVSFVLPDVECFKSE